MEAQKVSNLIQEIHSLFDQDFEGAVGWREILDWPVGESRMIGETVNTKVYQTVNHARFITQIPPKKGLPEHWHDCDEVCTPINGVLSDRYSGRTWNVDEKAVFGKGIKHIPFNEDEAVTLYLNVDFYK